MNIAWTKWMTPLLAATLLAGCARLPYQRTTETGAAGAAVGAAAGALLAEDDDQVLGAILGGVLGATAGYVIGAETGWFGDGRQQDFDRAVNRARRNPATVEDVYESSDADLNNDGLVTRDELIALSNAGLGPDEVIDRLEATNQIFYLGYEQRQALLDAGVNPQVVYELEELNRA